MFFPIAFKERLDQMMPAGFKREVMILLAENLARVPITPQEINLLVKSATSGIAAAVR